MDPYTLGAGSPVIFSEIRRLLLQLNRLPLELVDRIMSLLPFGLQRFAPRAITLYGGRNLRPRTPARDVSLIRKRRR